MKERYRITIDFLFKTGHRFEYISPPVEDVEFLTNMTNQIRDWVRQDAPTIHLEEGANEYFEFRTNELVYWNWKILKDAPENSEE